MQSIAATMADHSSSPPIPVFRLMDLPNELIKMICNNEELKIKDLKALRLTNKLLCEIVTNRFAEKCFHEIAVVMSRPSLQVFNQLSQHPRLGPYVSRIKISPIFVPRTGCQTVTLETLQFYENREAAERELSESGDAERMLGISFGAFADREQAISLAFTEDESNTVGGKGLLSIVDNEKNYSWTSRWKEMIEITIRAVFDHNCKISELQLQDKGFSSYRVEHASSFCTDKIAAQLESVCSRLTLIRVEHCNTDIKILSKSVKRMVKAAKQLKEFHLFQFNEVNDVVPEIIKDVASVSLEKATIAFAEIYFSDLIAFLHTHKQTLTEFDLSVACILGGTCKDLIAWIKEHLVHLRCLVMEGVCNHHIGAYGCDVTYSCTIDAHEDMQACLADISNGKREIRDVEH
ncbi:hypothetical protein KCU73_g7398, partial [Aureobasidium melanogenum]